MPPKARSGSAAAAAAPATRDVPAPPRLTGGGVTLDNDAAALVWKHLCVSPAVLQRVSRVSKEWREYVVATFDHELDLAALCTDHHRCYANSARRSNREVATLFVQMARRLSPFRSVRAIKAHDFAWMTDDALRTIAAAKEPPLSMITSVDVSGCTGVTSLGVKALVKTGRLRSFRQDVTPRHYPRHEDGEVRLDEHIKVSEATIKAAAASPVLESLSLTLGSRVTCKQGLEVLSGNTSLTTLALFMEGSSEALALPAHLPELKVLRIKVTQFSAFNWMRNRFTRLDYPKLEEIILEDGTSPGQPYAMSMEFLHYLRHKWRWHTIKLTQTRLFEREPCAMIAFRMCGPRRVAGPVTEENPLVLPPPTDGTRGPCCWFRLYSTYEDYKHAQNDESGPDEDYTDED